MPTAKTAAEIREHRDALLTLACRPCACADALSRLACLADRQHYLSHAELLSWALGEREGAQRDVDLCNEAAAKARAAK